MNCNGNDGNGKNKYEIGLAIEGSALSTNLFAFIDNIFMQ